MSFTAVACGSATDAPAPATPSSAAPGRLVFIAPQMDSVEPLYSCSQPAPLHFVANLKGPAGSEPLDWHLDADNGGLPLVLTDGQLPALPAATTQFENTSWMDLDALCRSMAPALSPGSSDTVLFSLTITGSEPSCSDCSGEVLAFGMFEVKP
ncbi:MAG TPA: hypothetical protein VEH82_02650 [Acidimicrobiales bacterium]|nr:hypothetical protein [Acidimicrobiales bacterium]